MSKTRDEIIKQALFELDVDAAGQPVEAEDAAVFDINAVAKYLAARRVIDLTADVAADALPDEFFFSFSKLAAAKHGNVGGLSQDQKTALEAVAIEELRVIANRVRPVLNMQFERMTY